MSGMRRIFSNFAPLFAASGMVIGLASPAMAQFSVFGTSADLNLQIDPLVRGGKTSVTVNVLARRAVSANNVYIELRCRETIEIDSYKVPPEQGKKDSKERTIKVRVQETVESRVIPIAQNQQYLANTTHQVKSEIEIPAAFPVPAKGKHFDVKCEARAGMSVLGNDPNSSWQEVVFK